MGGDDKPSGDHGSLRAFPWIGIVGLLGYLAWKLPTTLPILGGVPGLSPLEGAVLEMGGRLWSGENPYPDPVKEQALAFLYPPLAPALSAFAFRAGGGLAAARVLSALAVAATGLVLFLHVRRRNSSAAGLWAALAWVAVQNTFSGYFFLARVDPLANFLLVASLVAGLRASETGRGVVGAGALAAAALLAKQTAAGAVLGVVVAFASRRRWRGAALYVGTTAALAGGALLGLHARSGGWSTRMLLVPAGHPFQAEEAWQAFARLVAGPDAWILLALVLFGVRRREVGWNTALAATGALALVTASKWGGLTTALAPLFALALGTTGVDLRGETLTRMTLRTVAGFLAIAYPLALLGSPVPIWGAADPSAYVASRRPRAAATVDAARRVAGPILVNGYQEFPLLAGRRAADDLHAALECDLAGYPALERIAATIDRRGYQLVLADPGDLLARAGEVRARRPETAARLERCAQALLAQYQGMEGGPRTVTAWLPR